MHINIILSPSARVCLAFSGYAYGPHGWVISKLRRFGGHGGQEEMQKSFAVLRIQRQRPRVALGERIRTVM